MSQGPASGLIAWYESPVASTSPTCPLIVRRHIRSEQTGRIDALQARSMCPQPRRHCPHSTPLLSHRRPKPRRDISASRERRRSAAPAEHESRFAPELAHGEESPPAPPGEGSPDRQPMTASRDVPAPRARLPRSLFAAAAHSEALGALGRRLRDESSSRERRYEVVSGGYLPPIFDVSAPKMGNTFVSRRHPLSLPPSQCPGTPAGNVGTHRHPVSGLSRSPSLARLSLHIPQGPSMMSGRIDTPRAGSSPRLRLSRAVAPLPTTHQTYPCPATSSRLSRHLPCLPCFLLNSPSPCSRWQPEDQSLFPASLRVPGGHRWADSITPASGVVAVSRPPSIQGAPPPAARDLAASDALFAVLSVSTRPFVKVASRPTTRRRDRRVVPLLSPSLASRRRSRTRFPSAGRRWDASSSRERDHRAAVLSRPLCGARIRPFLSVVASPPRLGRPPPLKSPLDKDGTNLRPESEVTTPCAPLPTSPPVPLPRKRQWYPIPKAASGQIVVPSTSRLTETG